ncbi:TPA: GNAT family N-acetyltransferase [Serratia odorifera]
MLSPFVPPAVHWQRNDYLLSTDPALLDVAWVHRQLTQHSYWAKGQSRETTLRALACSLPFGLYQQQRQVGFGRLITDYCRFAYLSDVIVDSAHRGRGLGGWLATCVTQHPALHQVKRWLLATDDAHQIYQRAGWHAVTRPERLMEYNRPAGEERS